MELSVKSTTKYFPINPPIIAVSFNIADFVD